MSVIFDSQKSGSNSVFDAQVFTGLTLVGSNSTQTNTSSTGAISESGTVILTGSGSNQTNTSSSGSITDVQSVALSGDDSAQSNSSSSGAIVALIDEVFRYCTYQDLIDRFGVTELVQLTDRPDRTDPENAGSFDPVVIRQAIRDAEAEINSYLTAYPLPLAVVPANLLRIACDVTRYYLYEDQMIDQVQKRYDNALAWLKLVAAGKVVLPPDALGNVPTPATDDVDYVAADSVFTGSSLSGF